MELLVLLLFTESVTDSVAWGRTRWLPAPVVRVAGDEEGPGELAIAVLEAKVTTESWSFISPETPAAACRLDGSGCCAAGDFTLRHGSVTW
jgi:hypothetical protein